MSVCIIPDTPESRKNVDKISRIAANNGKIFKMLSKGVSEPDQNELVSMFRAERDRQYDEILEECQEFVDEIALNIRAKKTTQEEVEEMEEVLDGLRRWLEKVKSIDWIEKPEASVRVEKLLEKCQDSMDHFAELSHPK